MAVPQAKLPSSCRLGLPILARLPTYDSAVASSPYTCLETERILCEIWAEILDVQVGPHDDFFDLGGDSMKVIDVVIVARRRGFTVRSSALFRNPTPARLAEHLTIGSDDGEVTPPSALVFEPGLADASGRADGPYAVPIERNTDAEPIYIVHSDHGTEFERAAARTWTDQRPIYGFAPPSGGRAAARELTIGSVAGGYVNELLKIQPEGAYTLAGIGSGAVVAFEMARVLQANERKVAVLVMVKPWLPGRPTGTEPRTFDEVLEARLSVVTRRFCLAGDRPAAILAAMREEGWYDDGTRPEDLPALQAASAAIALAVHEYRPSRYDGPVVLIQEDGDAEATGRAWGKVVPSCQAHWFAYGLQSVRPMVEDPRVADIIRAEFAL